MQNQYINDDAKIIKLGYVGIINMRKGIRWLIAVLNEIKKDHTNINFELNLYGRIFREEYPFKRCKIQNNKSWFCR